VKNIVLEGRAEEELFASRRDLLTTLHILFMDTTSLYFEGAGGQALGRRGFSKDHRPDLNQMILAVLLDGDLSQPPWISGIGSSERNPSPRPAKAIGRCSPGVESTGSYARRGLLRADVTRCGGMNFPPRAGCDFGRAVE
jgi:hypothetical protein